jgi:hypothetical protein
MHIEKGKGSRTKTLGELALEMQQKSPDKVAVNDLGNEILKGEDVMKSIWECVRNGLKVFGIPVVFVELHMWMDRTIQQQPNIRKIPRASCPTPTYGQTVFKYDSRIDKMETLWSMPDRETSIAYLHNYKQVPDVEKTSLYTALNFYNGSLDALCKSEQDKQDLVIKMYYDDGLIIH